MLDTAGPLSPADAHTAAPGVFEVSWTLFGELCRALALRVYGGYDPELVIGIATAGVLPGAVIADILRVDFYSMKITRRAAGETPQLLSTAPVQAQGRRVLLVDEITTSGDTLRLALAAVREVGPADVRTATSFVRPGGYRPNYFAMESDQLIVYPWDRQVVTDGELVTGPLYAPT
jgi:hypoxanthine phosphoribosyltransferase